MNSDQRKLWQRSSMIVNNDSSFYHQYFPLQHIFKLVLIELSKTAQKGKFYIKNSTCTCEIKLVDYPWVLASLWTYDASKTFSKSWVFNFLKWMYEDYQVLIVQDRNDALSKIDISNILVMSCAFLSCLSKHVHKYHKKLDYA